MGAAFPMAGLVSAGGSAGAGSAAVSGLAAGVGQAGGGILGDLMTGYQSHGWAQAANQHAMAFTRWMDNTKYQRTVRDLRRAGLNPMLAYTQGAHTAGAPTMQTGDMRLDVGGDIGRAISSGKAVSRVGAEMKLLNDAVKVREQEVKQSVLESERKYHEVATEAGRSSAVQEEAMKLYADRKYLEVQADVERTRLEQERALLPAARAIGEFDSSPKGQKLIKFRRAADVAPFKVPFFGREPQERLGGR